MIISHWKFDIKKRNLLEFYTVVYEIAKKIYKENKSTRWKEN